MKIGRLACGANGRAIFARPIFTAKKSSLKWRAVAARPSASPSVEGLLLFLKEVFSQMACHRGAAQHVHVLTTVVQDAPTNHSEPHAAQSRDVLPRIPFERDEVRHQTRSNLPRLIRKANRLGG